MGIQILECLEKDDFTCVNTQQVFRQYSSKNKQTNLSFEYCRSFPLQMHSP